MSGYGRTNALKSYGRMANVETNPLRGVVMLYDGAIRFLRQSAERRHRPQPLPRSALQRRRERLSHDHVPPPDRLHQRRAHGANVGVPPARQVSAKLGVADPIRRPRRIRRATALGAA